MMRQTGGVAVAATSTRSRLNCRASAMAFCVSMMPSWRPSGLITRTWGDLIRMLRRMAAKGSLLRRGSRLYGGRPPGEEEGSAIQVGRIAGQFGRGAVFASNGGDDNTYYSEGKTAGSDAETPAAGATSCPPIRPAGRGFLIH